jgi:vanillin dehydrogenase
VNVSSHSSHDGDAFLGGAYDEEDQMTTTDISQATEALTSDLFIGGRWVAATGERRFSTVEALTGERIAEVAAASPADAVRAVDAAAAALEEWSGLGPGGRRAVLQRAAVLLEQRAGDLVSMMSREMGATAPWCGFNVMVAKGMLAEAAAQTYSAVGEVIPSDVPGLTALGVREPVGVVVGIAPWNAPIILGIRALAMPLAYGNTVVLKSSEQVPCTQAALVEVLHDAGMPAGAVNLISNAPDDAAAVVEALIAHPQVARVNFTGSTKVGRIIGELGGRHLTRVVLELGGKAPQVVLADADLDAAVDAAIFGAFMNQGQICMSAERLIVDRSVADDMVERLARRAENLVVGAPDDPQAQIGPMVHETARDHVMALIDDAVAQGAEVVVGGTAEGLYVRPTVLRGVTPSMRVYREESFGPLLAVIEVDGVDAAVEAANDSDYGLAAAVFTSDPGQALQVARRIKSGICHINGATVHDEAQMPFGGVGGSGWGRFGSRAALEEFTELRWITVQAGHRHYPI